MTVSIERGIQRALGQSAAWIAPSQHAPKVGASAAGKRILEGETRDTADGRGETAVEKKLFQGLAALFC